MNMEPSNEATDNTVQQDYLLKEFDKLNKELDSLLTEARSRERYSLTILAVVSAWMYTQIFVSHNSGVIVKIIGFIPLVIVLLYGLSVKHIYSNIKWIGEYLTRIENHFLKDFKDEDGFTFGWERYFGQADRKRKFVSVTYFFWFLQLALALTFAIIIVLQ